MSRRGTNKTVCIYLRVGKKKTVIDTIFYVGGLGINVYWHEWQTQIQASREYWIVDRWTSFKQGLKWFYIFLYRNISELLNYVVKAQWQKVVAVSLTNPSWTQVYVKIKFH